WTPLSGVKTRAPRVGCANIPASPYATEYPSIQIGQGLVISKCYNKESEIAIALNFVSLHISQKNLPSHHSGDKA
ncbi:hypothetical protein, partial [Rhodoferax sp.]|uniref:hypothetical protein n=1 Tax=Rhodoferax sp. TaxID=50421 RepID=UPI002601EA83